MSLPQFAEQTDSTCSSLTCSLDACVHRVGALAFDGPVTAQPERTGTLIRRLCRLIVSGHLSRITRDHLRLTEGVRTTTYGDVAEAELSADLVVKDAAFYQRVVLGGAVGAAESFLNAEWTCDDLTEFIRIMLRNEHVLRRVQSPWMLLARWAGRIQHMLNDNTRAGSRRNIQEHYDLGNDFFALFLDETMMYSAGLFPSEQSSLLDASLHKLDRVCQTLQLSPGDHVIEIGTGWGGFSIHAAARYGCHVTTTTISDEQFALARQRVAAAGLNDRVTVLKQDYRDLQGKYDKLVSIEMVEAVGRRHLPEYFATCDRLLKDDGAMLLQAITMPEQRYEQYVRSVDFIQKYIFPGGFLPSVTELQRCCAAGTPLRLLQLSDFGIHYARTLRLWNERFHRSLDRVRDQGFSERFIRMWRYYLCYCEAAFLERSIGVTHAIWAKPGSPLGQLSAV